MMGPTSRNVVIRATRLAARLGILPRYCYAIRVHKKHFGRIPNLVRPRTFNEKLITKSLRDRRHVLVQTADKAAVRTFVASRIGPEVLTEVFHVGDDLDGFDPESLTTPVVVKATHASGPEWIRYVAELQTADWDEIRDAARNWSRSGHKPSSHEWYYDEIPRRVIIEEYLGDPGLGPPDDVRFFVIGGQVRLIQIDFDRFRGHKRQLFTPTWEPIEAESEYPRGEEPRSRPANLDCMIGIAEHLGEGFEFVRVDLYDLGSAVKFGEMTHCPAGGTRQHEQWLDELLTSHFSVPTLASCVKVAPARMLAKTRAKSA